MPKRNTTDDHLSLLRTLRANPTDPTLTPQLAKLLSHTHLHGIVIKSAAALASQSNATSLAPAFITAARFLMTPPGIKLDPGCEAKTAVAKLLIEWDASALDFFLELSTYHQYEQTFGPAIDSAAECRGLAALAIARLRPDNATFLLTTLLNDKEKTTRALTATALGLLPNPEAAALLHLKTLLGDPEPEVMAEVFASLLRSDSPEFFTLICDQLNDENPRTIEAAALALGQSHNPAALTPLTSAYATHRRTPIASTLLMSIALLRTEPAITWLLTQLPTARPTEALDILDALALYRTDEKIRTRLEPLTTSNPDLHRSFQELFKQ